MGDQEPPGFTFNGVNANEAEAFIQAVRRTALEEEKTEDIAWMASFASTCLRGRAMRWHARLDLSIRKDWDLLVQAILEEWPPEEIGAVYVIRLRFLRRLQS